MARYCHISMNKH